MSLTKISSNHLKKVKLVPLIDQTQSNKCLWSINNEIQTTKPFDINRPILLGFLKQPKALNLRNFIKDSSISAIIKTRSKSSINSSYLLLSLMICQLSLIKNCKNLRKLFRIPRITMISKCTIIKQKVYNVNLHLVKFVERIPQLRE